MRRQIHAGLSVRVWGLSAALLLTLGMTIPASAQSDQVDFTCLTGAAAFPNPMAGLVMDPSGNLWGTFSGMTPAGHLQGGVFMLPYTAGTFGAPTYIGFQGGPTQPAKPLAGLIVDSSGNLYGTASQGGASGSGVDVPGFGGVFEIVNSPSGYTPVLLYSFMGPAAGDGATPMASLIMDSSGNLYGTTSAGGVSGAGIVFELINSSGTYTEKVLYSFTGGADGGNPQAGLVMDSSGNLYGTTTGGGAFQQGTVFELVNLSGNYTQQVLHSFAGASAGDGADPQAGLIMDPSGNLYGTTRSGGTSSAGTVFEMVNSSGTYSETVLYSFQSTGWDGQNPAAGLLMDAGGNLYGTTFNGGLNHIGSIFELVNSSGTFTETVLWHFNEVSGGGGAQPQAGLIMDSLGTFYGTTAFGDAEPPDHNTGTVFAFRAAAFPTTTTLTSSPNPAQPADSILFTATVTSPGGTPTGSVVFSTGPNTTTTVTLTAGQATLEVSPAVNLGIGYFPITATYLGDTFFFATSSATMTQDVGDSGLAVTTGSNTFTGNQTVNGNVTLGSGYSFFGNGSGLTGVTASTAVTITGTINDTQVNNLMTDLGGATLAAETYANNTFLPLAGGMLTGAFAGTSATLSNGLSAGGVLLPPMGAANTTQGVVSNPLDAAASAFSSAAGAAQNQLFRWQAEPAGNNTGSPSATLNLLFGTNGATPAETGLSINPNGTINFSSAQTFPGGGGGITGVTAGAGLSGGGNSGNVTLSVNTGYLNGLFLPLTGGTLAGGLIAPTFSGNGASLTGLNPGNLTAGTAAINITGNAATAATAGALAAPPTQCATGSFVTGIAANGNANCAQVNTTSQILFSSGGIAVWNGAFLGTSAPSLTESSVAQIVALGGHVTRMLCYTQSAPKGSSETFTLRLNQANTAAVCTIAAGTTKGVVTGLSIAVATGNLLDLEVGGPAALYPATVAVAVGP